MGRAMIALFIVGFFFICVSFIAGARGCWKTSPTNITASAVLMLVACKYISSTTFQNCIRLQFAFIQLSTFFGIYFTKCKNLNVYNLE